LLAFLQPRFDPSLNDDLLADEIEGGSSEPGPALPSQRDDEFRPFVRRLPEWQFWCVLSPVCFARPLIIRGLMIDRLSLVALFCTTSQAFDVPVYWPILVFYFITLFVLTMRRQIQYVNKMISWTLKLINIFQAYDQVQIRAFRPGPQSSLWWKIDGILDITLVIFGRLFCSGSYNTSVSGRNIGHDLHFRHKRTLPL
jgi:hypothetical protein